MGLVRTLPFHVALVSALACGLDRIELEPAPPREDGAADDASRDLSPLPASGASPRVAADGLTPTATPGEAVGRALPLDRDAGAGCGKVDFLFVIDNSLSMAFAQESSSASFPALLAGLEATLPGTDVQVMVVDTDGRDDAASEDACDALGSGRRSNAQTGDDCGLPNQRRFATSQAPLEPTVACLSSVGTSGEAREQQADALLAALAPEQNSTGGCNAGFSRQDAVLVVTLITNTDDDRSAGDPDDWYDALVRHKGGDEAAIVMLGFLPGNAFSPASSGLLCNVIAELNPAPRLEALVTRFSQGALASVCEADYGPTFASAVELISRACGAFVPPVPR